MVESCSIPYRASHTKKPPMNGGFFTSIPNLADCVLERLAGLEGRDLHRGDGDLLLRVARVDARASCALGNAEGSEARDRHGVSLLQFLRDHASHGLECVACGTLRD